MQRVMFLQDFPKPEKYLKKYVSTSFRHTYLIIFGWFYYIYSIRRIEWDVNNMTKCKHRNPNIGTFILA